MVFPWFSHGFPIYSWVFTSVVRVFHRARVKAPRPDRWTAAVQGPEALELRCAGNQTWLAGGSYQFILIDIYKWYGTY